MSVLSEEPKLNMQAFKNFRTYFFRGLAALLPTILTIWIFAQGYMFVKDNINEHVNRGVVWVLILAVIGARIYHILTPSPSMAEIGINSALDYFQNPLQLNVGIYHNAEQSVILVKRYESLLLLDLLQPRPGEMILDVGCGTGIFTLR